MDLIRSLALAGLLVSLVGCRSNNSLPQQNPQVRATDSDSAGWQQSSSQ